MIKIQPEAIGKDTIIIGTLNDRKEKTIALKQVLEVLPLPTPELFVGESNRISKEDLLKLNTLPCKIVDFRYFLPFKIKQGTIVLIKSNGSHNQITFSGDNVTPESKKLFQSSEKGDIILFKDIIATRDNGVADIKVNGTWVSVD